MRGEVWAGDGDCWLPIADRVPSKLPEVGSAGLYHPAPTYLSISISCHLPARTLLSCCFLITLCCRTCCSLFLECLTMSSPLATLLRILQGSASCLLPPALPSTALHREHAAFYTPVQIPAATLGLQLLQIQMGSGGSLGPADALIWNHFPVNTEGTDSNTES